METTFITIHDLSLDARILYSSSSIEDILGYSPTEVVGKSCWEYFHPDEIPFARAIHGRGVQLDKAAVLNYCQIKNKDGRWVGCECVFTIVHDVFIGCTSVYRRSSKSHQRAKEAPIIRRMFSSSPRDPRYHMLSYISQKFSKPARTITHEPRAALFLNRFSRTLTIMYATNGLAEIIGLPAHELCGRSFYYCIQENCLRDAVKCLESAKANDSIAYLRFWFRDPRQNNPMDRDEHMSDGHSSGDEDDGGVNLTELMDHDGSENAVYSDSSTSIRSSVEREQAHTHSVDPSSRTSSGNSTDLGGNSDEAIFDQPEGVQQSRTSSISSPDEYHSSNTSPSQGFSPIELEAVVSCTSDGLVVILRRAKPAVCHMPQPLGAAQHPYANGCFASPWASDPILPNEQNGLHHALPHLQQPAHGPIHPTVAAANMAATNGPAAEDFMNTIRDVAVFAWALTGINGSLEQYGRGTPSGESQPPGGFPVWDPRSNAGLEPPRPIRGEILTDSQNYDANHRNYHHDNYSRDPNNYAIDQPRTNGYWGHHNSDSGRAQHQSNYNPSQLSKFDPQQNGYGNGLQAPDQERVIQFNTHGVYEQANSFHDSSLATASWQQQQQYEQQQQQMWNNPHQAEQGGANLDGHQGGRSLG